MTPPGTPPARLSALEGVPIDVLARIVDHCGPEGREKVAAWAALSNCSRALREAASKARFDIESLEFGYWQSRNMNDTYVVGVARTFPNLCTLFLTDTSPEIFLTRITSKGFSAIARLGRLKNLRLYSSNVDDKDLRRLANGLPLLEHLNIGTCSNISDKGLRALAKVTTLTSLDLFCCNITAKGMRSLRSLTGLTKLDIAAVSDVDRAFVEQVAGIPSLRSLTVGSDTLRADMLAPLAKLSALTSLDLYDCYNISGKGLEFLAELPNLENLYLTAASPVVDVAPLDKITSLKSLSISNYVYSRNKWQLSELVRLTELTLKACHDQLLEQIAGLPCLEKLHLSRHHSDQNNSDVGMKHLGGMVSLREIQNLRCARVSVEGFRHLTGLPALETLSVIGVRHMPRETPATLKSLSLDGCSYSSLEYASKIRGLTELSVEHNFTGSEMAHLSGFVDLTSLSLLTGSFSGADMVHLSGLVKLTSLDVESKSRQITDAGVASLGVLTNLRRLTMKGCPTVTDEGMEPLGGLTCLERLCLEDFSISDDGLERLSGLTSLTFLSLIRLGGITGSRLRRKLPRLAWFKVY